jgi:hypothetical protein
MIYLFIIAVAAVSLAEGIPLIKKGMWKEFYTIVSLLGISAFFVVLSAFGLSTPFEWLNNSLIPVGKLIFKYH